MSFATNTSRLTGTRFNNKEEVALTVDDIRRVAPSAFATTAHESRSARFAYIPTSSVIEGLMREGFQPFKAVQSKSRIEGKTEFTKHMIRFRHPNQMVQTLGDSIPEVILVNAHDGTSAYKLMIGLFRLVCTNGLVVADSLVGSLNIPHKGNVIDRVIEGSFQIIGQADKALQVSKQWGQLQLTNGEQQAFATAAHTARFEPEFNAAGEELPVTAHPIQPQALLTPRRYDDNGNDLWSTFNRVQENVIRGGLSGYRPDPDRPYRRGRRVSTRQVNGIDQDVKLNRSLWTLASEMAKLKGVAAAA